VLAKIARGSAADIDRAARAAARAFPAWSTTSGEARKTLLHKIADKIVARADEIAFIECMDTGQALRYMSKAALRAADNFRFFADRAPGAQDGLSLPAEGQLNYTIRQPIGPVGVITPWNTPFMLSTWKIAPALAAGCTVVQAAEWALTAMLLSEIASECCPRVLNLCTVRRGSRQGADRASRHQSDRLRWRERHRLRDHGAGRADAEARAFRARRQKPGHHPRRRRSRPRRRCGAVHDLFAERRALHLVEPGAGAGRRL
jgi:acyl-CoA reductase-like NAD-dependent aldehyde dehydrogenase